MWRDTASLWEQAVRAILPVSSATRSIGVTSSWTRALPTERSSTFTSRTSFDQTCQTYGSLAMALESLGRRDAAIDAYRAGLALTPENLTLRLSLAAALLAAGRLDETVGVVDEAGRFYDPTALASYYGAAAQHRPEAPVPRLGLVRAWTALGDRDRARGELDRLHRRRWVLPTSPRPGVACSGSVSLGMTAAACLGALLLVGASGAEGSRPGRRS